MTKEEYLSQVRVLSRRIEYHNERLLRLRREADAVSSRWGEGTSCHSQEAPFQKALERVEEAREQLEAENALLAALQGQVEEAVDALPDPDLRLVLLYHYLEGMSYARIGELLFLDKGTVFRRKERAMAQLELPEEPIVLH